MNYNDSIRSASEFLHQKIEIFLQYEQLTDKMLTESTEDLLDYVDKRQGLVSQIDCIEESLRRIYEEFGGEEVKQAAQNQMKWVDCSPECQDIFMVGQQLVAVLSRISRKDEQVEFRVEERKVQLLSLIREQNLGISAKAEKYYRTSKHLEKNTTKFNDKY